MSALKTLDPHASAKLGCAQAREANVLVNPTHRRHPRTLNEAFGPYADRTPLIPMNADDPMPFADKLALAGSIVAALVVGGLLLIGIIT